ncbi:MULTISPECIES: hypothetical protein [unclassified Rhodococcus (in: high G+C Gram-positive bacteria)]|uniref:hypothetical protein n=1 Tax=unclassified Rhodococcus (in: high G+C Gram-positive bacteria) TaxID=192944 RepID=UPI001179DF1B|nr:MULTISPECIES: hypothetical protein [unclassified Rhodococcus (in: high G+C Gram-positive bacteria)]
MAIGGTYLKQFVDKANEVSERIEAHLKGGGLDGAATGGSEGIDSAPVDESKQRLLVDDLHQARRLAQAQHYPPFPQSELHRLRDLCARYGIEQLRPPDGAS